MPADKEQIREYLHWVTALQGAMEGALHAEDPSNVWKYGGYKQFARKYQQIIAAIVPNLTLPPILDQYDLQNMRGAGDTIAFQQKAYFEGIYANVCILRSVLERKAGVVEDEFAALRDFIQARLRSAVFEPPTHERDIQNVVEQLLIGRGMQKGRDYDREVGRVKISAKEVVPDFILPRLSTAIEIKLIKEAPRLKPLID